MASGINIGKMFVDFGADFSDLSKDVAKIQNVFEGLEGKFTKTGTALSLAITAPLAGIGAVALNSFGDFEAALNKVSALQGIFGADMDKLKKQALDLGAQTQFSAKQAADAMGEFAAQGFNATQIYEAMPGALNLAAAGQLKVADAANISAAILKGFNLETTKISDVANVLAKAAGESAVSVQDLGFSFKYVGPVASAAGVSFTETAAALAALGNAGIKGEMGGTAIRNMISDLIKPSKEAARVLSELKISTTDATGKLLPMGQVIQNLQPLTKNLTAGFQVFGVRFSEVLPLLKLGEKGFEELNKKMIAASQGRGAATEMAENLFKGWNAAVETFKGSIETTLIKIGDVLAKPAGIIFVNILTPLLNGIGNLAEAFGKLPYPVQAVALGLGAVAAAAGPAILAVGGLMRAVSDLKGLPEVINAVGEKFFYGGLKIQEFGTTASKAIKAFAAEFSAANIAKAGSDFKTAIVGFATSALDGIKALPANAKAAIAGFAASIGAELASHSAAIKNGFASMMSTIASFDMSAVFSGIGAKLSGAVSGIVTAMSGFSLAGMWSSIVAGFASISTAVMGFVSVVGSVAVPVGIAVAAVGALAAIGYEIYKNWDSLTDVFAAFWRDIQNIVGAAAKNVGVWIDNALGAGTTGRIAAVWSGFAGFFSNLWAGIISTIDKATRFIVDQAQRAAYALNLKETAQSLANWRESLDKAAAGIKTVADTATSAGRQMALAFNFTGVDDAKKKLGELNDIVKLTIQQVQTDITFKGLKNSMQDASALKTVLGQLNGAYEGVIKLQKDGKISDKEAADMKASLARQVQEVKGQLGQLQTAVPATTAVIEKHAKKVKETEQVYKSWRDKARDLLDDMAKDFESFASRVGDGLNWNKDVKKIEEMMRDIARAMEGVKTPAEKLKLALQFNELGLVADQYREWGKVMRDADIPKRMEEITQAANTMRAKKALDFSFSGLTEINKTTKETEDNLRALGIEVGNVYEKLQGKDVRLQKLEEAQKAYDYVTKKAKEFNVSQEDLEKATVTLAKARADYYFGELGGIDGVTKAFNALGQQPPLDFTIKTDQSVKALEELRKQFDIMKASGLATPQQLQDAWLSYLEKKLDAEKKSHANIKIENAGLFGFISAKAEESATATQIAFLKGMNTLKTQLSKDFGDVFSSLFDGNFKQALSKLTDLGNNAWKNLKATFLSPFEKAFKDTFNSIGDEISGFVTKNIVGTLMGGFNKVTGGLLGFGGTFSSTMSSATKSAQNLSSVLGDAANNLTKSANNLTKSAQQLSTAAGLGGNAAGAASQAAASSASAASAVGGTIAKSITGALTNWVAPISAAVSAVTDVIALFGQRRMEKDLGRIEVTTREIFSQLLSIQGDVNKYWPYLMNLTELMRLGFFESVMIETKQELEALTGVARDILKVLRDGINVNGTPSNNGGPDSGDGDGGPDIEVLQPSAEDVDNAIENLSIALHDVENATDAVAAGMADLGTTARDATRPLSDTVSTLATVPQTASNAADGLADVVAETDNTTKAARAQTGVFAAQGRAIIGSNVAIDKNRALLSDWEGDVYTTNTSLRRLSSTQQDTTTESNKLAASVEGLQRPLSNVAYQVSQTVEIMDASAQHYEDKLKDIGKELSASATIMDQAQKTMEAMGVRLTGTVEENRIQYLRMYNDMYGFSGKIKETADRVDPFAKDLADGFLHVTDVLGNAQIQVTGSLWALSTAANSGMAGVEQAFTMASDDVFTGAEGLSSSLGYLGNRVASATNSVMSQIAAAGTRVNSTTPVFTPAGETSYTPSGGGPPGAGSRTGSALGSPGGPSVPKVPYTPPQQTGGPAPETGEISLEEFKAKGYKYGRQTASGGIVPIGPPAETPAVPGSGGTTPTPSGPSLTAPAVDPAVAKMQQQIAAVSQEMMLSVGNAEKLAALTSQLGALTSKLSALQTMTPTMTQPRVPVEEPINRAAVDPVVAKLQQQSDAITKQMEASQGNTEQLAVLSEMLREVKDKIAVAQQNAQTPVDPVDPAYRPPAVPSPTPASYALPSSAYTSSPAAVATGGPIYNINVTANNADADKIAEIIINKIRRSTGR